MQEIKKQDALSAILRSDLYSFVKKALKTVDPSCQFVPSLHIDLICHNLQEILQGKNNRLIVNIPPRNLKSICISVAWPAWILGLNPSAKIMVSSYSQALSNKHSLDCRLVLESSWYKNIFKDTVISFGENEKNKFVTTKRGFRLATSTGGLITGEGADYLIVDDPHNATEVLSKTKRNNTITWFEQAFTTRLNDKNNGSIVIVMQRLHSDDLSGVVLEKPNNKWLHVNLPAIALKDEEIKFLSKKLVRKKGDVLNPKRENLNVLKQLKQEMGSYAFSAQYQQNPAKITGGMINLGWFKRYDLLPNSYEVYQSWDTATKTNKNSDYSVCSTWFETDNAYYLVDVLASKMEYPKLNRQVKILAEKYNPKAILIEDKASGQALLQDLNSQTKLPLIAINPIEDKVTRFSAITAIVEAGKVYLPRKSSWLISFEEEISLFPHSSHDDMVDSFSQFLNWRRKGANSKPRLRKF